MFIICPKCSAKYKIPEGITLENGQKLKCSACDFVFVKEEEKPFVLAPEMKSEEPKTVAESPVVNEEVHKEVPKTEETFPVIEAETPVWSNIPPVSDTGKSDSLSETFQPVEAPKNKKGLWLIPIYILSIAALCWAGWTFRDSLKPSFKSTFSNLSTVRKEVSTSEKALDKITPKPVVPQTVTVKPLDESPSKEEIKSDKKEVIRPMNEADTKKSKQKKERNKEKEKNKKPEAVKVEQKVVEKIQPSIQQEVKKTEIIGDYDLGGNNPAVSDTLPLAESVETETINDFGPTKITDLPLAESIEPLNSITAVEPEPDDIPLFDIVEETKPVESWEDATWKEDVAVNDLSFRVEINEDGLEQVLVEGEIQNTGLIAHSIPPFDILILNKDGKILNQKKIHLSTNQLEAGEAAPFYTSLVPAPKEIDHIDIRF